MKRTTEQASNYHHLDRMSTAEIIEAINAEDRTVPVAVAQAVFVKQIRKETEEFIALIQKYRKTH